MDAAIRDEIAALKTALSKLPDYSGVVFRGTSLPPELLAQYQPGAIIIEHAFTSTTQKASMVFPGNVVFKILSKTGKDISPYSVFPDELEVVFAQGVVFEVIGLTEGVDVGTTVITMAERSNETISQWRQNYVVGFGDGA